MTKEAINLIGSNEGYIGGFGGTEKERRHGLTIL